MYSFIGFHLNITSLLLFSHHVTLLLPKTSPSLLQYAKISLPLLVQRVQIWYAVLHIYLASK